MLRWIEVMLWDTKPGMVTASLEKTSTNEGQKKISLSGKRMYYSWLEEDEEKQIVVTRCLYAQYNWTLVSGVSTGTIRVRQHGTGKPWCKANTKLEIIVRQNLRQTCMGNCEAQLCRCLCRQLSLADRGFRLMGCDEQPDEPCLGAMDKAETLWNFSFSKKVTSYRIWISHSGRGLEE